MAKLPGRVGPYPPGDFVFLTKGPRETKPPGDFLLKITFEEA